MTTNFKPAASFDDPAEYQHIPLTKVDSNQVGSIGYDPARKVLAATFARGPGHVYHYPDVSPETHAAFMAAESKGTFFGQHIKALPFSKYHSSLLEGREPQAEVTPASIAAKLNGLNYPLRIPAEIAAAAKAAGIVIVYGASDDLMEFEGAIRDEVGVYDGGTAEVDAKGLLGNWESLRDDGDKEEIADFLARQPKAQTIEAIWTPEDLPGTSWAYKTSIPHVTFDVIEDDDVYCKGIVFALADIKPAA